MLASCYSRSGVSVVSNMTRWQPATSKVLADVKPGSLAYCASVSYLLHNNHFLFALLRHYSGMITSK